MAFDPCRDWLGIAAVDLADPRKVLGLPPGVLSADAVSTAAAASTSASLRYPAVTRPWATST